MIKKLITNNKQLMASLILLIVIIGVIAKPFFRSDLVKLEHDLNDLQFQAPRIANYYLALTQGQLPPRWAPNLQFGFGYPVLEFIYQYPLIVSTAFYVIGLNIQESLNATIIVSIIMAGLGMYLYSYQRTKKTFLSLIPTLLYIAAPYSLLNLYVRGAVGEVSFWGLLPWVLIFIQNKKHQDKLLYWLISVPVFVLFLLSHQISLMIAIPVLAIWFLITERSLKKIINQNSSLIIQIALAILISQFFWTPMLIEKSLVQVENDYAVRHFWEYYPESLSLLYSPWNFGKKGIEMSFMVGWAQLGVVLLSLWLILGKFFKRDPFSNYGLRLPAGEAGITSFWLVVFFLSLFLMLPISKFIWQISLLPIMQFPWRLLWLAVFSSVMLSINILEKIKLNKQFNNVAILAILILLSLGSINRLIKHTHPEYHFSQTDYEWFQYPLTSGAADEHLPKGWDKNINNKLHDQVVLRKAGENLFIAIDDEEVKDSIGESEIISWDGTHKLYKVKVDQDAEIIEKTSYFAGWETRVDGQLIQPITDDSEFPGRIIIPVKPGEHTVESKFTNNTGPRRVGNFLTVLGLIGWVGCLGWVGVKKYAK